MISLQKQPLILVTGANGQLGSELKLLAQDLPFSFLFTDIEELNLVEKSRVDDLFQKHPVDFCINCAAYTAVDKAEEDEEKARLINAVAVKNLAETCSAHNAVLIHISTDFVFDGSASRPIAEDCRPAPVNAYGKTKLEGEQMALAFCTSTIIIRTSWLYSSYGSNFVKTMLRLASIKNELGVIFDQVGTPTYARDLAGALLQIIDYGIVRNLQNKYGIYHYSNEGVASWYDFARAIFDESGIEMKLNPLLTSEYPTLARRPHYTLMDKGKIRAAFDLKIPYWRNSLRACLNTLKNS